MKIYVIGIGPGDNAQLTPRAAAAISRCEVVAGYHTYIDLIRQLLDGKELIATGMKGEVSRCKAAVEAALSGKATGVISSGDAGVYGMAGLVHELAEPYPDLEIEVIPGVTAATAAAAVLGAPLGHDFAVISLSDLLTDQNLIDARLKMAAGGDFVICIYNPTSKTRTDTLRHACDILLETKPADTPCGIVRQAGRSGQHAVILTLGELRDTPTDMFTTIIIGNSSTRVIGDRLVTPRGYNSR